MPVMDTARQDLLPIGQFAQAVQLSLKALRLYDQLGLLTPARTDPDTGYRSYGAGQLPVARMIRLMRQMDMPLALIRDVLAADAGTASDLVRQYRASVEAHAARVRDAAETLLRSFDKETMMAFEVQVKEVPTQRVAGISRKVLLEEVGASIEESLGRLRAFVAAQGGEITGPPFGIYHEPITRENAGLIEVSLPMRGALSPTEEIAVKEMPGGRMATTLITGEARHYPAKMDAYYDLHHWINGNGSFSTSLPREVWRDLEGDGPFEIQWLFEPRTGTEAQG